ncbi:F0F1 ATP synthase subunit A [uncultured Brachyspira sp.]|uniref:F0F1 ATP synthase subunit A n=1 Tax=uncultured Brachyspira sp. TaxID=221953 RepID=UPI0025F238B6|nr:F0F1 ATP synthase subunit A [uncultured Brachyspira sp.]
MNRLIFIRNVFIMFLICFSVFSNSHAYASISINDYIMEEIGDNTEHPFLTIPIKLGHYIDFDFKITKHIILVTVAGILSILSMKYLAHKLKRPFNKPTYLQNILEIIIDYMNKDVIGAALGEEGKKYVPFCLTVFLFVLFSNLLGLLPALLRVPTEDGHYAYLAGGLGANIGFTGAIALLVFIVYIFAGIRKKGIIKYWVKLVPKGLPIPLIPIIWVLEFITLFNRAFALTIRLFANITGGHIMMIVIPYLIIMSGSLLVSPFAVLFLSFIYVLEMFVAVLQAYIFSLLSAVYIQIAISDEH